MTTSADDMIVKRAIDLPQGFALVVTDLHGVWDAYARYRDMFLTLHAQNKADVFILLGDVIHGYGPDQDDCSLDILLDIMQLQNELGPERVIMLLGNHEMPHIYSIPLRKGNLVFTPRFEHALGIHRAQVIDFLKGLPFLIRTPGGVMLTHAGASAEAALPQAAQRLLSFSHHALLNEAQRLIDEQDRAELLRMYERGHGAEYSTLVQEYLAVTGPEDVRYDDLLRGFIVSQIDEFGELWSLLFSQCERGVGETVYGMQLAHFLDNFSTHNERQRVLVTGHIGVRGGYAIVSTHQLRLASWAHAHPPEAGCYLLFDIEYPVHTAVDLLPFVHPILQAASHH